MILRANWFHYFIDQTDTDHPVLMVDDLSNDAAAQPGADGIEDLQVALGIDSDGNGMLDDDGSTTDEWIYNNSGDTDTANRRPVRAAVRPISIGAAPHFG